MTSNTVPGRQLSRTGQAAAHQQDGAGSAESDFFEPLTVSSLIVPGHGGRMYFAANEGFIPLQVKPATS